MPSEDMQVVRIAPDDLPAKEQMDIDRTYADKVEALEDEDERVEHASALYSHLMSIWSTNRSHWQQYVKPVLDKCTLMDEGKYDQKTLSLIRQTGGSEIYIPVAAQLARIAEAWMIDILSNSTMQNRPWALDPTPIPELPEDLEAIIQKKLMEEGAEAEAKGVRPTPEQIQKRANELYAAAYEEVERIAKEGVAVQEKHIDDKLEESNFIGELKKFISYLTKFPTAFMVGPLLKPGYKNVYRNGTLEQVDELQEYYAAVSPYDMFPAPDATSIDDGDLVHRVRMSRRDLAELKKLPSAFPDAIDAVLDQFNSLHKWTSTDDYIREDAEKRNTLISSHASYVEALNFYCSIPATLLGDDIPEACLGDPVIEIEATVIGSHIVRCCVVDTKKPFFKRPIYATSYRKRPDSIWGDSVLTLSEEINSVCNSTARSLVNNMSIASGPQVVIDISALPQGTAIEKLYPWQIHQVNSLGSGPNQNARPIYFFQPNSNAQELIGIFNNFLQRGSEITGVPLFLGGQNPTRGAAATARGLAQLMEASSKSFQLALSNITEDILKPVVIQQFYVNMEKGLGRNVYGDVKVVASGFNAMILRGAQSEAQRDLLMLINKSPATMEVIGLEGYANLLNDIFTMHNIDSTDVIPPSEEIKQKQAMLDKAKQMPKPDQLELELQKQKLELDKYKADQRAQIQRERLQWEREKEALRQEIKKLELQVELQKTNMDNQAELERTIANAVGKEKLQKREIAVKAAYGSGL